jgi:protein-L-isoaspartate(D-aspartate) O-methyltransferase
MTIRRSLLLITLFATCVCSNAAEYTMNEMIRAIRRDTAETERYTGRAALDARVLAAMEAVPRDRFVPDHAAHLAWLNRPLPIGHGQTISQPFIVALMTDLLEPQPSHRVLEIGTGSGYQAAVLAELVASVHTIEIIPELAARAAGVLTALDYDNVEVRTGDGWYGWPEAAPFDGIIVTAVAETVPPKLLEQLAPGGHMVLPIGPEHGYQELMRVTKTPAGKVIQESLLGVQFVPLTGEH